MQCILLIIVPMTIFLSLLSKPVWTLFYGESIYGPLIYKVFVFGAVFGGLYGLIVNALQGLNKYKLVITSVLTGLLINTILDIPFMLLCHKLNIEASYGAIFASIIGYFISIITSMYILKKKYNFEFKDTFKKLPNYIISWVIFTLIIVLFKLFIPINLNGRLIQIPILIAFGVISFGIYILINYKNGNITNLFDFKRLKNKKKI